VPVGVVKRSPVSMIEIWGLSFYQSMVHVGCEAITHLVWTSDG